MIGKPVKHCILLKKEKEKRQKRGIERVGVEERKRKNQLSCLVLLRILASKTKCPNFNSISH